MKHKILICFISIQAFLCATALPSVGSASAQWSWRTPQAKALPTGDLEWTPRPFEFKPGASIRYIDFDSGSDANDGLSRQTPWKHHPWDANAAEKAAARDGARTYVFKQGVVYRGEMNANESGAARAPITLTRDPSWGEGPAVICGSETARGWKKGAENALIPELEKVWYVDLDWAPRNVWTIEKNGDVKRVALARSPNWMIVDPDDIKSKWWAWKNPEKPFDNYVTINEQQRHLAFDKEHINTSQTQDYYEGAIVWTTKGWVMGSPFPARVLAVDRENGSLAFPGQWGGGPSYKIIRGCRYYLEDKPHYLDSPGEFWFEKKGGGGRLYLRPPGDQNPNDLRIEVAKRIRMIDSRGMSHVRVSGLTFRFTNVYWNLLAAPYWVSHETIDAEPGCVRLLGSGSDIEITNCVFEHVHRGVRMKAMGKQDAIDKVTVSDNVFAYNDHGAVDLQDGTVYNTLEPPMGRLYDVRVMRNKFDHIGVRPDLFGQGGALTVNYAQTVEVAGNIFSRVCAQAIDVHGAKQNRAATNRPFTRILIHQNKAVDTLLNVDDFGGIETWQGGPAYVYNNISGNPGGYRNWDHVLSPDTEDRFGHAYYLDGAFKNYYFNNIAWGKSKGPSGKLANTSAFQEIISYQNTFFNNTLYNFVRGSRRQAPQAGRVKFLGNIWQSMGLRVFRDADPARTAAAGNEADAGARRDQFAIETNAYARNVFHDVGEQFGVLEPSGQWLGTLQSFREVLESYKPLAATVGVMAEQSPLRDPAAHDFRPSTNSAARGLGAKVFVPWSLYETVAEWHFYPIPGDPTRILDEHWCMSPYYTTRDDYYKRPTYPLRGVNIALEDFGDGPLENWTTGALRFNGRDQYAILANEDIGRAVTMDGQSGAEQRAISGADLSNPDIHVSNFLIEAYFKTIQGQADATLIKKMDKTGYALLVNEAGGVSLEARAPGVKASLASQSAVNDGRWRHVIAEADRQAGTFTIYIDGKRDAAGPGLDANASLTNDANLYVGGAPQGNNLDGAIEFMRIARGTLADARTTIEELYAWEFDGPFLYDFTGHPRPGDGGSAGALGDVAPLNSTRQSEHSEWVDAMREVHSRFDGRPGTFAHFGDSITVTLANWTPLLYQRKNASEEMERDFQLVQDHVAEECWREWKGPKYGNEGRMTVRWADENVDAWLRDLDPEVALIMFGTNDLNSVPLEEYEAKLRTVVSKCLENGTVVILSTIPPRHGHAEKAAQYADAARGVARETRVPLIDYHAEILKRRPDDWDGALPKFEQFSGYDVPTLIARDGVHPSHPKAFQDDYSEEALGKSGFSLRNYLALTRYAEVLRALAPEKSETREEWAIDPPLQPWFPQAPPLPKPRGETVEVSTVDGLFKAVAQAKPGQTILLADGHYLMPRYLTIRADNVTLRGKSGRRERVILDGVESSHGELVGVFDCSGVTIAHLTIQNIKWNGFKLNTDTNVQNVTIYDCIIHNIWQRGIKGVAVPAKDRERTRPRNFRIQYCLFYNDRPKRFSDDPADTPENFNGNYIGGIDAMYPTNWTISDNVFVGIRGRTGEARGAVFLWHDARDCVVERNIIIDGDTGVCLGNSHRAPGTKIHATRCVVRNNFVTRCAENGILADYTSDCSIAHNTVHDPESRLGRLIRIVHDNDGLVAANNLLSGPPPRIESSSRMVLRDNIHGDFTSLFRDAKRGNLRLTPDAAEALGKCEPIKEITEDIERQARHDPPTVGADEIRR